MEASNRRLMRISRLFLLLLALVVTIALVAACGSSNTSDTSGHHTKTVYRTTTRTTPHSSTSTQPTSTTTASTTTTPATTTSASKPAAQTSECTAGDLTAKQVSSNGAAGTIVFVYTLTNSSKSDCYTYGWPGVGYLGTSGQTLPTTPTRVTRDMVGSTGSPKQFTISPGSEGSFRVTLSDVTSTDGGGCVNAAAIEITPPNDTQSIKLPLSPRISTCGRGTVTPMQAGTTAASGTA